MELFFLQIRIEKDYTILFEIAETMLYAVLNKGLQKKL